ncbi:MULTISPECIES: trypsin-like peptidase domain-containing protein [unclassified Pseudoalteromonas]|uniref:trypsin-like peptidase domain-containing protein n=1 Tax=unclassified Pseudoalteromonas TaxID=194690 RepID=UPI002096D212|nr:trypsin-like peptidase domain-containing protein [Pseudoalteromonas sp. XMcav2-N]MCO7189486.1 trypsin-like peptidase domain-containing protein [Pseudoalteromonas sp. XMcav2-N]
MKMNDSVVMVHDENKTITGTGFSIKEVENGSYVATCYHTVEKILKSQLAPIVNGIACDLVSSFHEKGVDLAVLFLPNCKIRAIPLAHTRVDGEAEARVCGWCSFNGNQIEKKEVSSTVRVNSNVVICKDGGHEINYLKLTSNEEFLPGYSGSPIFCVDKKNVIGVLSCNLHLENSVNPYGVSSEYLMKFLDEIDEPNLECMLVGKTFEKNVFESNNNAELSKRLLGCENFKKLRHNLVDINNDCSSKTLIEFSGLPGVGKSVVASYIYHYCKNSSESQVHFIDLMSIEKDIILKLTTKERFERSLNLLGNTSQDAIYIFDGVDEKVELSEVVFDFISNDFICNVIIFKRSYKGISHCNDRVGFQCIFSRHYPFEVGLPIDKINELELNLLTDFSCCQDINNEKYVFVAAQLLIRWFFESRNNIRLLNLLIKYVQDSGVSDFDDFNNSDKYNGSLFLECFFRDYVERFGEHFDSADENMKNAANFAYRFLVTKDPSQSRGRNNLLIKRIATQSFEMLGWLCASHICDAIKKMYKESLNGIRSGSRYMELENVYPYLINKHAKNIILRENQSEFVDAIISIYDFSGKRLQAFLCYLLGRVTKVDLKQKATKFLLNAKNQLKNIEKRMVLGDYKDEDLVLHRTIYISLIYLNQKSDEEYIKLIASSKLLDSVNKGFHLSYYGDGDYIQDNDMVAKDANQSFKNTLRQIEQKIYIAKDGNAESLFNLVVYTLFSLALGRLQRRTLSQTDNNGKLKELAEIALKIDGLLDFNRSVLKAFLFYYNSSLPPFSESLVQMYKLKETPRTGWNKEVLSDKIVRRIRGAESVSSHTDFAVRLAQIYLPSNQQMEKLIKSGKITDNKYLNYDKSDIIIQLINHDLGEYYAGDVVDFERTEESNEREHGAVLKIALTTTCGGSELLADPYETVYKPWLKFNRNFFEDDDLPDINTCIARDLDSLECLIQLILYKKRPDSVISDYSNFKKDLIGGVKTVLCRHIMEEVVFPIEDSQEGAFN